MARVAGRGRTGWAAVAGLLLAGRALAGDAGGARGEEARAPERTAATQRGDGGELSAEDLALVRELELLEKLELVRALDLFEPEEEAPAKKP